MIDIIFSRGYSVGPLPSSVTIRVKTPFCRIYQYSHFITLPASVSESEGYPAVVFTISVNPDGFSIRFSSQITISSSENSFVIIRCMGEFNFDSFSVELVGANRRVEIRNENGVLLADNGLPWSDGTYPPDAKNREGLAGLHSAPIASSNDFADLSGLDPNKEVEMIGGERGEGMQYALERNDDNGL